MDRESRIGKVGCRCFDIFNEYSGREISVEEMNRKLDDVESKQSTLILKEKEVSHAGPDKC